jgi:two-component system response regulator FixJ
MSAAQVNQPVIHIVDDDHAIRQSVSQLLVTEGFNVKTYASADAFAAAAPADIAGCLITDVRMPGMTGIALLQRLKQLQSPQPVIVMTAHGDVPLAIEAMKAGATDFLEKPVNTEALLNAVRTALDDVEREQTREAEVEGFRRRLATLSAREKEVLARLIAGDPNKIIAYRLNISPRTVEVHRANLMLKMDTRSLSDLVRLSLLARRNTRSEPDLISA